MITSFYRGLNRDEADLHHVANSVIILYAALSFKSFYLMKVWIDWHCYFKGSDSLSITYGKHFTTFFFSFLFHGMTYNNPI